jgi:hypothetical protein
MPKIIQATLLLFFIASEMCLANSTVSGQLLERGTKKPLAGVNIYILPHKLKAVSDENGSFIFSQVPNGGFDWVINLTGYEKLSFSDSAPLEDSAELYKKKR